MLPLPATLPRPLSPRRTPLTLRIDSIIALYFYYKSLLAVALADPCRTELDRANLKLTYALPIKEIVDNLSRGEVYWPFADGSTYLVSLPRSQWPRDNRTKVRNFLRNEQSEVQLTLDSARNTLARVISPTPSLSLVSARSNTRSHSQSSRHPSLSPLPSRRSNSRTPFRSAQR